MPQNKQVRSFSLTSFVTAKKKPTAEISSGKLQIYICNQSILPLIKKITCAQSIYQETNVGHSLRAALVHHA